MNREEYTTLSLEEKRNEFNKETIKLLLLINKIVDDEKTDYYNYVKKDTNEGTNEEKFLIEEYLQVKEVSQKLIDIFK